MKTEQENLTIYWKQYKESRDVQIREVLVNAYLPLVRSIAATIYRRRVNDALSFQDILHYGMVGLLDAIDRFVPEKKVDFKVYAKHRIKGEIFDGLSSATEVSSQLNAQKQIVQQRVKSLSENNTPQTTLEKLLEQAVGVAIGLMLEGTAVYQEDENTQKDDASYHAYSLKELKLNIGKALLQLPEKQKKVVELHYIQGFNFTDIANIMNLSRSRISQLHKESLLNLKLIIVKNKS